MSPAYVNLEKLRQLSDNDMEDAQKLLNLFFDTTCRTLKILENNVEENQEEEWNSALHELKGAAYSLGFFALGDLCEKAEQHPVLTSDTKQIIARNLEQATEYIRQATKDL